jgi:hypothetical protein
MLPAAEAIAGRAAITTNITANTSVEIGCFNFMSCPYSQQQHSLQDWANPDYS